MKRFKMDAEKWIKITIVFGGTGAEVVGAGIDEVDETGAAVELCEEEGGVALRFWGFYPVQACSKTAVIAAAFAEDPAGVTTRPHG